MYINAKYLAAGDMGLVVEFGNAISPEINEKVRGMMIALDRENMAGVLSLTPTYRSLLVQYDPVAISFSELVEQIKRLEHNLDKIPLPRPRVLSVPTLYGGEAGPDMGFVCEHTGLPQKEIIKIHSAKAYLVYMLGFSPGFPYLGGMDERIAAPRLQTPRIKITAGSVGIAGSQTGIYSIDSPGGWQLIGKTPLKLYDPQRNPSVIYEMGDYIRFVPITEVEYAVIEKAVAEGAYKYELTSLEGEAAV